MSVTEPPQHSYLKVLFDFQYKTAEGREIIINKNERLYLLQKTNADWWQVVRNLEQRSFYVPATYVREISKNPGLSVRKNSEEDRETIFEPPQNLSYKSMPKESSNAMRNVKKWLAGAVDSKSESQKSLYDSETVPKSDANESSSKSRLKVGLVDTKTKSLERDRRSDHFSDKEEGAINGSPRSRNSAEYQENSVRTTNRFSTSPKSSGMQLRIDSSLQDPFRRELESSLDRRNQGLKIGERIRTRSMNSEGSHSDGAESREMCEKIQKNDSRNEQNAMQDSLREPPFNKTSKSLDLEANKPLNRPERSTSPKPIYGRQMTIAAGSNVYQEKKSIEGVSSDQKILNDKRRTWAVEELMSELTQMCKERGATKKPTFQLKSTEVKTTFDPIEKLTREIHEMNRLRSETNTENAEVPSSSSVSKNVSPINICKISINSTCNADAEHKTPSKKEQSENSHKMIEELSKEFRKSGSYSQPEIVLSSSPRSLKSPKSPKSPKILDEYNEANILNDCYAEGEPLHRSLSPDKSYQRRASPTREPNKEPCYSNVKMNAEKTKVRPKLRIKTETSVELKLTPSLEKLASEIQFLPAKRSDKSPLSDGNNEKPFDETSHSDDSLDRRNRESKSMFPFDSRESKFTLPLEPRESTSRGKLEYKGSFKTSREYRDRSDVKKKSGLKKSSTLNSATIPECYRRFRKNDFVDRFETVHENSALCKRRSRSLSDLESLEVKFVISDQGQDEVEERKRTPKSKPVPLPRTKIPTAKIRESLSSVEVSISSQRNEKPSSSLEKNHSEKNSLEKNSGNLESRRNIESSTAVGFKSLLCASDSGSDNCLQSKELLSSSADNLNDRGSLRSARKSSSSVNFNDRSRTTRESLSDDQILSSNASSEALHSESELTATFDVSSQPSPVRPGQDSFECAIELPPGWKQKYDSNVGQVYFLNEQGDKDAVYRQLESLRFKPDSKIRQEEVGQRVEFFRMEEDECCFMEEKSLMGYFHVRKNLERSQDYGESQQEIYDEEESTEFDNEESEDDTWLPEELRRKISFEKSTKKQCYPLLDWLKEIRSSCDLYEAGLPVREVPVNVDEESITRSLSLLFGAESTSSGQESRNTPKDVETIFNIDNDNQQASLDDKIRTDSETRSSDDVTQTENSEAGNDEMTRLLNFCEIDKNCGDERNEVLGSQENFTNPSVMKNSSSVRCCTLNSDINEDSSEEFSWKKNITKNLYPLGTNFVPSDVILCLDDVFALQYLDCCFREYLSTEDVITFNEDDKTNNSVFTEDRLSEIQDISILTDSSQFTVGYHNYFPLDDEDEDLSTDDIEPIFRWIEQVEKSNSFDNINDSIWLQEIDSDVFKNEKESKTHFNSTTLENEKESNVSFDSTTLERNLDTDSIKKFNNFNTLETSTQTANRNSVETFNIFNVDDEAEIYENFYVSLENETNPHAGFSNSSADLNEVFEKIENNEISCHQRRRNDSISSDVIAWKKSLFTDHLYEEESFDQWFSSSDAEGKIYFFEENSNESSWVLPSVESEKSRMGDGRAEKVESENLLSEKTESGSTRSIGSTNDSVRESSMKKAPVPAGGDWPHLCDGNNMLVLKEGVINRTKITENGKKLRKNWNTSYAVLTELFLLFFKDAKTFTMMKTGQSAMAKPDISVDLNGALVEPGERASSRKNVYMISTVLGLQVLIQSDNGTVANEWFEEIHAVIRKLPSGFKSQGKVLSTAGEARKVSGGKQPTELNLPEDSKKSAKISRSRSMKMKRLDDSLEDLSGSAAERQTKIKAKLRRFFQRRPAVELLVKNGIYKDEPAFGSYLSDVCPTESPRIPLFVKTCIEVLESNEENMKTDGLYRASGNLSQIQKIRLQVDQYKLDVLAQEEDVHVLAGALKLFFRELKEPLIPSSFLKEAVNASMLKKTSAKIQCFREIVKALPPPNYDTLQFLLKHLLKVTSYQEFNRMHIPNLAIVFGPTLMWPAEESANMALDYIQQNLVIECLLSEYNKIFK